MIVTVHCVSPEAFSGWISRNDRNLKAICGFTVARDDHYAPHTAAIRPRDFKEEKGFKRSWIRCGKCFTHEDLPLHLLGELDDGNF